MGTSDRSRWPTRKVVASADRQVQESRKVLLRIADRTKPVPPIAVCTMKEPRSPFVPPGEH